MGTSQSNIREIGKLPTFSNSTGMVSVTSEFVQGLSFLDLLNDSNMINYEQEMIMVFSRNLDACELDKTDKNGTLPITSIIHLGMTDLANKILDHYDNDKEKLEKILQPKDAHRLNYLDFNVYKTFASSPLMTAINRKMTVIVMKLLKHPELCGLDEAIDGKTNALHLACEQRIPEAALEILKYKNTLSQLRYVNEDGYTALMLSNSRGLSNVSMKMLEHPELCALDTVDKYGENALMIGIRNELTDVSLKILKHNTQYARCVNNRNTNALMLAIENGMTSVATEILTLDKSYPFDYVNSNNDTALMLALRNKLLKVALLLCSKIDEPYLCNINNDNESALSIAIDNDLCYVAHLIYDTCIESSHNLTLNQLEKLTKIKENYKKLHD